MPRSKTTEPESGASMPAMMLRNVDFPAPFGAMRPTFSPSEMESETSAKRSRSPKDLVMLRVWSKLILNKSEESRVRIIKEACLTAYPFILFRLPARHLLRGRR